MSTRRWAHGSTVRTCAALVIGALIALGVTEGGAGASPPPNTFTGCLVLGVIVQVAVGASPAKACPAHSTQITWNETAQTQSGQIAVLNTRVDTLTADLQSETQTRSVVDDALSSTTQSAGQALNAEDLDFLQSDVQNQIATTQDELSQTTDAALQAVMSSQLKSEQMMSNVLHKLSSTANALTQNVKP